MSSRSPGEVPLIKKKQTTSSPELPHTPQQSTPIGSLPDDLLLSCFARISRLYYPTLSLVSKSFRSLLSSPELYKTRSLLGRTEICLYVCLQFSPGSNPRWFTLCQKHNRNNDKNSSGNLLVPISIPNSPDVQWKGVVSIGSSIYAIGGPVDGSPSSDVWVLDCHCHAWRKAPSMRVERKEPAAANVFDGKVFVGGGCRDCDSSNWMEVFDPKTQTWETVLCPLAERCISSICRSAVIEGRIYYMFGTNGVAYKPNEDRWEATERQTDFDLGWPWHSYCVMDNVLYCCYFSSGLKWYDTKSQRWRCIHGLRGQPEFAGYVKLAGYGGKLVVLWTKYSRSSGGYKETRIWCAVIVLERRNSEEIWGTVERLDHVLTVPNSSRFKCALVATV